MNNVFLTSTQNYSNNTEYIILSIILLLFLDIEKLRKSCLQVTLDGRYLKIKKVTVTNCVIVTGYSKSTSPETIETYFDNKRRSGVENVTNVRMNKIEGYSVVSFEDAACKYT